MDPLELAVMKQEIAGDTHAQGHFATQTPGYLDSGGLRRFAGVITGMITRYFSQQLATENRPLERLHLLDLRFTWR